MNKELSDLLDQAASGRFSHIRINIPLQPVGEKVFPPTYQRAKEEQEEGPIYAQEERQANGKQVRTVLIDSCAARVNSFEKALLAQVAEGLPLPRLICDLSKAERPDITSLELPHRTFDTYINKSALDGVRFRDTQFGKQLLAAGPQNATPLFELDPAALLFGVWGQGFGVANLRFARAVESEIVAYEAVTGVKTSSKSAPHDVPSSLPVYTNEADTTNDFRLKPDAAFSKEKKPSAVTLGAITPTVTECGGITATSYKQFVGISVAQLRNYSFPVNGKATKQQNQAACKTLISLALLSVIGSSLNSYSLRSRCHFQVQSQKDSAGNDYDLAIEFLGATTASQKTVYVQLTDELLQDISAISRQAIESAIAAGLPWRGEGLKLTPDVDLLGILSSTKEQIKATRAKAKSAKDHQAEKAS